MILFKIAEDVRARLQTRRQERSFDALKAAALSARRPHSLRASLTQGEIPAIIAEVKPKSPSEGVLSVIADDVAAGSLAAKYHAQGAQAISILTERDHFGGGLENLAAARKQVPQGTLLMKDFILEADQLYEARLYGADAVLLIAALLEPAKLFELQRLARELGLSTLVEVHNEEEMKIAAEGEFDIIGVNNRCLRTLTVSLDVSKRLGPLAPADALLVAESGIRHPDDARDLQNYGFKAFLIGTQFMRSEDPARTLADFRKALR